MTSIFVKQFIMNLNNESGIKFAKKYNIIFTLDEAKIIIPFLKQNVEYVNKENKEKLLFKIKNKVSQATYIKVNNLVEKLVR